MLLRNPLRNLPECFGPSKHLHPSDLLVEFPAPRHPVMVGIHACKQCQSGAQSKSLPCSMAQLYPHNQTAPVLCHGSALNIAAGAPVQQVQVHRKGVRCSKEAVADSGESDARCRTVNCCSCPWTACCAASTVTLQVSQLQSSRFGKLDTLMSKSKGRHREIWLCDAHEL